MSSPSHTGDGKMWSRPCDNVEYAQAPSNEIGQRLGETLHRVFCDLHDENQLDLLAESTGLSHEELFETLFVTDRYRPSKGAWPMNRFYHELLGTTRPQRFNPSTLQWELIGQVPELREIELDPDDRDLATMLLSGDDFRPTILVGRVGCGKTSFLKRFIQYVAPRTDSLKDFALLHLDFTRGEIRGRYFGSGSEGKPFDAALHIVLTEYFNAYLGGLPPLSEVFDYTYRSENIERTIETWPEGVREARRQEWYRQKREELDEFNYGRIKYLQYTLGKRVVVCLDNVDRWAMTDQRELIKNALYRQSWYGSGLLLVVRHNALTDVQRHMCYSQFRPFKKHLTPPRIDQVLRRRFKLLQGMIQESELRPYALEDVPLSAKVLFTTKEQLVEFLGRVTKSLTAGEAEEFVRCFTNHSVRRMLDFVELYLCSPNTEIWRYLPDLVKPPVDHSYVGFWDEGYVGLHTVLTVAALGHGPFYHRIESSLCNLFSNDSATARFDALIRLRVLEFLNQRDSTPQKMLWQGLAEVGYDLEQIRWAIDKLSDDGLLESRDRLSDPNASLFTTVAGKYYLRGLVNRLAYIQHMRDGCFLPEFRHPIGNRMRLEERLLHTAEFIKFLDEQEQAELKRGFDLNPASYRKYCGNGFSIPRIARKLLRELRRIKVIDQGMRDETTGLLRQVAERSSPAE